MIAATEEWQVGELSERGPVRDENQDRMCSIRIKLGQLHILADGMGGHKAGALAAQLTIDGLHHGLDQASSATSVAPLLRQAFEKINQDVYRMGHSSDRETQGMGSTAVLLLISDRTAHIAHVGDSRAYLYRKGRLRRLTTDHTKAQRMVDAAILTPDQALDHPSASVLERAVGIRPTIEVDLTELRPVKKGDGILLCTDGLSGCVNDAEIEEVLNGGYSVHEIPKRLFELALRKGSKDNITVQYLQYGKRNQGGLMRIMRWTAVAAVTGALLLGLIYLFGSYREHRAAKLKEALTEAQQRYHTASQKMQTLDEQLSNLKARLADIKHSKKAVEQEIVKLNDEVHAITKERDANVQEKQAAADKVRELEQQVGRPDMPAASQ